MTRTNREVYQVFLKSRWRLLFICLFLGVCVCVRVIIVNKESQAGIAETIIIKGSQQVGTAVCDENFSPTPVQSHP